MKKNYSLYTLKILVICMLFTLCVIAISALFSFAGSEKNDLKSVAATSSVQVVIDAGHGGRDGGASSESGIMEKELNIALSQVLSDYLSACGVESVMTRREDSLVCDEDDPSLKGKLKMTDLKNRLAIAEDHSEAVFISIHMNKFPIEKYSGLQVYYSPNNEKSVTFAQRVEENVKTLLQNGNNRKSKAAGSNIYILDRITLPAVLIECGFLSNNEEARLLSTKEYRGKLALIFGESIFQTLANN